MLTDVQRIELAFPAEVTLSVVNHGTDPKDPTVQLLDGITGAVSERRSGEQIACVTWGGTSWRSHGRGHERAAGEGE